MVCEPHALCSPQAGRDEGEPEQHAGRLAEQREAPGLGGVQANTWHPGGLVPSAAPRGALPVGYAVWRIAIADGET